MLENNMNAYNYFCYKKRLMHRFVVKMIKLNTFLGIFKLKLSTPKTILEYISFKYNNAHTHFAEALTQAKLEDFSSYNLASHKTETQSKLSLVKEDLELRVARHRSHDCSRQRSTLVRNHKRWTGKGSDKVTKNHGEKAGFYALIRMSLNAKSSLKQRNRLMWTWKLKGLWKIPSTTPWTTFWRSIRRSWTQITHKRDTNQKDDKSKQIKRLHHKR
jgi:hypothetical protein